MKILLLEEYSGFYKNLKDGLIANGHDVTFIATQDGWKKIDGMDYIIGSKFTGYMGKIVRRWQLLRHLHKMRGFDVVLLINQSFLFQGISSLVLWYIKKNNKKLFLSACGGDVQYALYGLSGGYKNWGFDGIEDIIKKKCLNSHSKRLNKKVAGVINGVIPITYEYAEAWRNSIYNELLLPTIPPPINTDLVKHRFAPFDQKIIFFHGLNRGEEKGTKYIQQAMVNMASKYPDEIEIIIKGGLPLNQYLELLSSVNVVIDNCNDYSYSSMNGLYSMALGKIVMRACAKECLSEYGITETPPIIPIIPDVKQIESQMEWLINNKAELKNLSIRSRSFVLKHHNHKQIAKKYEDQFLLFS